jgi:thioredoxin 1
MEPIVITSENFEEEVVKSDKPVLLDFWSPWCGPCKMLSPVVDKVAEETEDIKVGKVNVDDNEDLAMKFKTMSIPTLIVFKDGVEVNRSVGVISKSEILDLVK